MAAAAPVTTQPATPVAPRGGGALPNPRLTPGESFAAATVRQVCTPGYASSVRHVTAEQYRTVYGAYGLPYPEPSGSYQLDHLIPLELGGDNTDANLWPEPASPTPGFREKDALENTMHDLVCSGRLDLREAQREMATNWYAAYLRYLGG
ncbi:MAG TPA: HNH endonuclease [Candidatus Dormibacteraeota bacterium]